MHDTPIREAARPGTPTRSRNVHAHDDSAVAGSAHLPEHCAAYAALRSLTASGATVGQRRAEPDPVTSAACTASVARRQPMTSSSPCDTLEDEPASAAMPPRSARPHAAISPAPIDSVARIGVGQITRRLATVCAATMLTNLGSRETRRESEASRRPQRSGSGGEAVTVPAQICHPFRCQPHTCRSEATREDPPCTMTLLLSS